MFFKDSSVTNVLEKSPEFQLITLVQLVTQVHQHVIHAMHDNFHSLMTKFVSFDFTPNDK